MWLDDFNASVGGFLDTAQKAAGIYSQFAGTGGSTNQGELPYVAPVPVGPLPEKKMSPLVIAGLVLGGAAIVYLLWKRKG